MTSPKKLLFQNHCRNLNSMAYLPCLFSPPIISMRCLILCFLLNITIAVFSVWMPSPLDSPTLVHPAQDLWLFHACPWPKCRHRQHNQWALWASFKHVALHSAVLSLRIKGPAMQHRHYSPHNGPWIGVIVSFSPVRLNAPSVSRKPIHKPPSILIDP